MKKTQWQKDAEKERGEKTLATIDEDFYCICCDKQVNPTKDMGSVHDSKPEAAMWHNGIVDTLAAGYGSSYDTSVFFITICDDCVTKKFKKGNLIYSHNYFGNGDFMSDEIKESSRNNKLKGLLGAKGNPTE